jgi:alpha/beta hydrolase family protein DUF900
VVVEGSRAVTIRGSRRGEVKNVLLIAPDVDVDVFRTEIQQMGKPRPRLEGQIVLWGKTHLGDANLDQAYWSEFDHERILVFDLTHLQGNAHSRAFEDVTSVMGMMTAFLHKFATESKCVCQKN